jgi:phosphatidylglycerophosphatase C
VAEPRCVAAFDFDGTISERDTLTPFLAMVCGRTRLYGSVARRSPAMAATFVGLRDRDGEKERLLTTLLRGRSAGEIRATGARYAEQLLQQRPFRLDTLDRLAWHRSEGHDVVIVSASLDVYLEPIAAGLGVEHVIATRLAEGPDGRLTGRLEGPNVRGPEKASRLRAWLGDETAELWAYGDSAGDRELLAMADHAHRV